MAANSGYTLYLFLQKKQKKDIASIRAALNNKKMKTKIFTLMIVAASMMALSLNAQTKKSRKEIIREEKMIFINDYCKFTDDEAKKFWPLHDEMQEKLIEIRKSMRKEMKDIKDRGIDNVSETELKKAMDNRKNYEQKLLDTKWDYNQKLIDVAGIKKTAKFHEGEIAFRKKLIDRLKDLKMDGRGDEDEDN